MKPSYSVVSVVHDDMKNITDITPMLISCIRQKNENTGSKDLKKYFDLFTSFGIYITPYLVELLFPDADALFIERLIYLFVHRIGAELEIV